MRRLLVIVIGLFTFMAVSPALAPVMAGSATFFPGNSVSTAKHGPALSSATRQFSPRIDARHCAVNQPQSAYCVLKGAFVETADTTPAVSPKTHGYRIVRHQHKRGLVEDDGPLRPPRYEWNALISQASRLGNPNGGFDI